jgi:type VI secretion system protein ImpL
MTNNKWSRQDNSIKKYRKEQAIRLNEQVQQFAAFLKETQVTLHNEKKGLFQSPWHLIAGSSQSGKTTLLSNSELGFVFRKKQPGKLAHHEETNWWATKEAVIVDAPGDYFNLWHKNSRAAWKSFLKVIKKNSYQNRLSSATLVIDYHSLVRLDEKDKKIFFHNIRQQITDIKKIFSPHVNLFLIINKMDAIAGFPDFFEHLSAEQRQQPWGIAFDLADKSLFQQFNDGFDPLIARLKNQTIHLIHRENKPNKKFNIYQFPVKFHALKSHLSALMQDLSQNNVRINGLFFTSSAQTSPQVVTDQPPSTETLPVFIQPPMDKGYFIHDVFTNLILNAPSSPLTQEKMPLKNKCFLYAGAIVFIGFIIAAVFSLTTYFIHQTELLSRAENAMAAYQASRSQKNGLTNNVYSLDYLKNTLAILQQSKAISPKTNSTVIYQKEQAKLLLPLAIQSLEKTLQTKTITPSQRYATLKAYLMLNDQMHFDKEYLFSTLKTILSSANPDNSSGPLLLQLSSLLDSPIQNITLNNALIHDNQDLLQKVSSHDLFSIIFQNQFANQQPLSLNLSENPDAANIFTFIDKDAQIADIYTTPYFEKIFPDVLKTVAQSAETGDWVTGEKTPEKTDVKNTFLTSAGDSYLNQYADAWNDFLNNIQVVNYTSLDQLDAALTSLSGDKSLLLQLLQLTKTNLPSAVISKDESLQALMAAVNQPNFSGQIKNNLLALQLYVHSITQDQNPDKKALKLAANRMRNKGQNDPIGNILLLAKQCPDPVQDWLFDIGINAWTLILAQAEQTINDQWQKEIVPSYQNQIANRFPFSPMANNSVGIDSFEHFFAANGAFDRFFSIYLYPFIDNTESPWQTKNVDGYGLQLPRQTLNQLQAIYQIQMNFFGNNQHVYIPFSLQPISMGDNVASITISLGDQTMTYQNKSPFEQKTFVWPSKYSGQSTTVTLNTTDNKQMTFTAEGLWGWLKLLKQAGLHPIEKTNLYQATFEKEGASATMTIALSQLNNPFDLSLFKNFNLPQKLT